MSVTKLISVKNEHLNKVDDIKRVSNYDNLINNNIYELNMEIINRRLSKNRRRREIFQNEKNKKILKICRNVIVYAKNSD